MLDVLKEFMDIVTVFDRGIRLSVKARPAFNRSHDVRLVPVADGKRAIEVAVAAVAEDGKANKAILVRLAKELNIKSRDIALKTGQTSRLKCVEIRGDPDILQNKLAAWFTANR